MKSTLLILFSLCFAAPEVHGEIFTWTDSRGTTHYTNSQYEIPARYLGKAKMIDVATGQKKEIAAAPPTVQATTGTAPPTPTQYTAPAPQVRQERPQPTRPPERSRGRRSHIREDEE